ncbi:MAG: TonB-dependent receptor [Bacteroidales bacterium]|nr:TonB-dependent receptor [Bacteroidales bacterium]
MTKFFYCILCLFVWAAGVSAQTKTINVSGTVKDENGEPLVGANVYVKDQSGLGVAADVNGQYRITVGAYKILVISYIGYETQEHQLKEEDLVLDVVLKESESSVLNEVVVTASGTRTKVSVTGAISSVNVSELRTPVSSITNAMGGVVPGVLTMQQSGQPGANNAEFWIRGISTFGASSSALVMVDGFERSLNELNIEDIESFTVLKDASATAIYGSRGANGVILITTKRGKEGKVDVNVKAEYTWTTRTITPEFADGYTYAGMANEARTTRNMKAVYTDQELMMIRDQLDPDIYPNVNWSDLLLKSGAPTYRASLSASGGGATAKYYLSGSYLNEGGMYHVDKTMKEYNTNANYERYNYRLNVDLDVIPTTKIHVGIGGSLEKTNHSGASSDYIWYSLFGYNPVTIPVMYSNGYYPVIQSEEGDRLERRYSPWVVSTQTGYNEIWKNTINTNISLEQDLGFITEGLKVVGRFGYDTFNENRIQRRKNPEMWRAERQRDTDGNVVYNRLVTERLLEQYSGAWGNRKDFLEADLAYARTFSNHTVGGILKYTQDNFVNTLYVNDLMDGIAKRHQGLAGNVYYRYANRYFADFNFGYNGSENFAKGHQFGFFPAFSVAWNLAEESFLKETGLFELLKFRFSSGKVGTDNTSSRFPYLAEFDNLTSTTPAGTESVYYNWGDINSSFLYDGLAYLRISSNNVTWEVATKYDLGLDLNLMKGKFELTVDYFRENRDGIYMQRVYLPEYIGIQISNPSANVGATETKGFDGNFKVHQKAGEVELEVRGNFTYSKNKITESDEMTNRYPYLRNTGYRIDQAKGLIDLGLFKDYDDIRNSPRQDFGNAADIMPGDIKYKDVNGDGVVNDNDNVPIGATMRPNLIYGLGVSAAWKGFDLNIHFQGAGKSNFFINGYTVYPFQSGEWGNILKDVTESNRWILDVNEDPNAEYPRLSYGGHTNNYRPSTYWLRNGAYLRLKTLEIGYTLPKALGNRLYLSNVRLHIVGQNILTFSSFKMWDPEMGSSDGQKYPLGRTWTFGLNINI